MSTSPPGLFNMCNGLAVELFVLGCCMLCVLLVNDAHSGRFLKENLVKLRQREVEQQLGLSLPLHAREKCYWSIHISIYAFCPEARDYPHLAPLCPIEYPFMMTTGSLS